MLNFRKIKMKQVISFGYYGIFAVVLILMPVIVFGATTVGNNVSVGGTFSVDGNVTLGDAATDTVTVSADVASNILPEANNTRDLGAYDSAWSEIYASGTLYADAVTVGEGFGSTGITMSTAGVLQVDGSTWVSSTFYVGSAAGGDDFTVSDDAVTVGTTSNSSTLAVYGDTAITGHLVPQSGHNNNYSLGVFGRAWSNAMVSGTMFTTNLNVSGNVTGGLRPSSNNGLDIGAFGVAWNEIFSSGTAWLGVLSADGNVTLGDAATDTVTVNADVASNILPEANNTRDLGAYDSAWNDLFASGTIHSTTSTVYNETASGTIYINSGLSGVGGELILEDEDGAGCSAISVLDGVVSAGTVTCPAYQ